MPPWTPRSIAPVSSLTRSCARPGLARRCDVMPPPDSLHRPILLLVPLLDHGDLLEVLLLSLTSTSTTWTSASTSPPLLWLLRLHRRLPLEVKGKQRSLKGTEGENEQAAEEDGGDTSEKKKVDGGDVVKEEKDHMKTAKNEEQDIIKKEAKEHEPTVDENRMQERVEKEVKEEVEKPASPTLAVDQTVAPASGGDAKKGTVVDEIDTDKISEVKEEREDRMGGAKGQDEPPIKEDKRDAGEARNFDGGDADEPQAGEGEGKDEGREGDRKVFDVVDEQPTAGQDGGGGDTSAADVTSSLAPQPLEPQEENPAELIAAKTTTRTVTPPALPPATTSASRVAAVQAALEPKEHGNSGRITYYTRSTAYA